MLFCQLTFRGAVRISLDYGDDGLSMSEDSFLLCSLQPAGYSSFERLLLALRREVTNALYRSPRKSETPCSMGVLRMS